MRIAYADPPYIRQAKKHYKMPEVDHAILIKRLIDEFPDGWALSMSAAMYSLKEVIPLLPDDARLGSWVKPFAIFKPGVNPAYAWEPIVFKGGRKKSRIEPTVRDWVSCNITLKKGLTGVKPEGFSFWLFDLMGMQKGDDFVDLFPGTNAVTEAWQKWIAERD